VATLKFRCQKAWPPLFKGQQLKICLYCKTIKFTLSKGAFLSQNKYLDPNFCLQVKMLGTSGLVYAFVKKLRDKGGHYLWLVKILAPSHTLEVNEHLI
jgi:hypothetical protein